jgi:hypothetical protein
MAGTQQGDGAQSLTEAAAAWLPTSDPVAAARILAMRPSKTWGCYGRPGHGTEGQNEVACRDGGDGFEWDRPRS